MLRLSIFVLVLLSLASCASASVDAVVELAHESTPGTVTQGLDLGQRRDPLVMAKGERVSFTPSSFKVTLRGLFLCSHVVFESGSGVKCPSSGKQLSVVAAPREVELAGQAALSPLLQFSASVPASELGDYQGATLLYGQENMDGRVVASGTVTRKNGDTATYQNLEIPLGTGGIGLEMATPVQLVQGASAKVRVFFDIDSTLDLTSDATSPRTATTADGLKVTLDHFILLPYVGSSDPTVERYRVDLATDDFGPRSAWYVRIDVLRDPGGAVATAGWRTVFIDGYLAQQMYQFAPGPLYAQALSQNADGSWVLKEDPTRTFVAADHQLAFPAFSLSDHQGTLAYGAKTYAYTARKLP